VETLQPIGVKAVSPSHCTGGTARRTMAEMFGDRYLETGAGRVLTMEEIRGALK
jgi:metal-dependent hydrolase (beta-lactamase superfamily II)